MRKSLQQKIIQICNDKISAKGEGVGLSFYAFLQIKMTILNY